MATYFKNVLTSGLGTTETLVMSTPNNATATIIGLSLTNLTSGVVLASIRLVQLDDISLPSPAVLGSAYYVKQVAIPPNQSLRVVNGGEKLVLASSMKVLVQSNVDSSLDLVMSYAQII